jgi:hypothetical protein
LAAMVSAHLEGNVLAGRPPRQNWGKFNAHKWGGFNARSHAPNGHDDSANVVAGVVSLLAGSKYRYDATLSWV